MHIWKLTRTVVSQGYLTLTSNVASTVIQLASLSDQIAATNAIIAIETKQQRVASARALIADPTILICDEPTGDLDQHSAEEIMGLIQILNRKYGKTVVAATHDAKAAEFAMHQLHLDKRQLPDSPSRTAA